MKKLYALVAAATISANAFAQTTLLSDDFASASTGNNTSTSGSSSSWPGDTSFPSVGAAYQAGGAVKLGSGSSSGFIKSKSIDLSTDGGSFTLKFDVKGWTNVEGDLTVTITGLQSQTITYSSVMAGNFQTITIPYTGGQPNSTITIATTAKRAYIDNVSVVTSPSQTLSLADATANNKSLLKNTLVQNSLEFGAKSDVKIINMSGQVVKSASVESSSSLDVSGLAKGMYIVTGTVNGEKISQKIIKK